VDISALVISHGSIGKRHAEILTQLEDISEVSVLSNQDSLNYRTLKSMEEIPHLNPDYVVIASPTSDHYSQLKFLDQYLEAKKILVEKPLFNSMFDLTIINNQVYVGYNLRFHPLIHKIREAIEGKTIWSIHAFCGSYLPDWRPDRDYRETSSASKALGGGVLLDLSHELDYIQWLVGTLQVEHVISKKVSNLEIDSDDLLMLTASTRDNVKIQIGLNYFTHDSIRQINIDGEGVSIKGDLIANTLSITLNCKTSRHSWPKLARNTTFQAQHRAILDGDLSNICSFDQGIKTMQLIDKIRFWPK
tara:strand:+ start:431 stop:1342 length:912 start_codon:yes stop_codon:yes gene_type:complete